MLKAESADNIPRDEKMAFLRPWVNDNFIRVRESVLNQLVGAGPTQVINGDLPEVDMAAPDDLAAMLKQSLEELKISVMDGTGAKIDYRAFRKSPAYAAYQEECLAVLRHFNPGNLPTQAARRAFWINLYNALVMDAVISFDIRYSVTEGRLGMLAFFRRAAYLVDGRRVSLEDMEHGILRSNHGNPYVPGAHFTSDDPRLAWSLPLDPRLHFALNCGGQSCPPIRSYSANKLNEQLDLATRGFIDTSVKIDPETTEILLSRIFQWYAADFGGHDGILAFLLRYLPDDERRRFIVNAPSKIRLRFTTYDWALNNI